MHKDLNFTAERLIRWYRENGRCLPWRNISDPYLIWISEIILQQTRVVQGLDYFNRFVARFPDVKTLAEAHEDEVLKYWQGLGYYSRARNLHAAACDVMTRFGGVFPVEYREVLSLKGIGEYTAAAVCSFAYRQPYAVVDGNVYRVLSRLFAIDIPIDSGKGRKYFAELAGELLDREQPDLYNQAIMDFGALQCLPQSPDCSCCPFQDKCLALASGTVAKLPVKEGKTVIRSRYFNYLHIRWQGNTLLSQRKAKDIWQNLYEFPLIETDEPLDFAVLQQNEHFCRLFDGVQEMKTLRMIKAPKHVLSHRIIYAGFYEIEVSNLSAGMSGYLKVPDAEVGNYAVSRLIQLYQMRSM